MALRSFFGVAFAGLALAGCGGHSASDAQNQKALLELTVVDPAEQPVTGAIVAVSTSDGTPLETTTDVNGVASFPEVDLRAGAADVTVFSPSYFLVSVLGVDDKSSKRIYLHQPPPASPPGRTLSVTFKNKVSSPDCVFLSSSVAGSAQTSEPCNDSGTIAVPVGASGKLWAREALLAAGPTAVLPLRAAVALDFTADTNSVEVDFSKSLPIEHAVGTAPLPDQKNQWGGTFGAGEVAVSSLTATGGVAAWQTDFARTASDADARTTLDLQGQSQPGATQTILVGVETTGYPGVGAPTFPSYPAWVTWSAPASFTDPITWTTGADRPNHLSVTPVTTGDGPKAWQVWFPSERGSVTLPKLPDSISSKLGWQSDNYGISISYCEPEPGACKSSTCAPGELSHCARYANVLDTSHFHP